MFKKLFLTTLTAAAFCASTASLAGTFYAGPTIMVQDSITTSSSYRGLNPKMTLGYGELGDGAYFAGEIYAIPGSATLNDNHLPGAQSAKMSRGFGLSVLPGVVIGAQTIGYARLGVVNTKFVGPNVYKTGGQIGLGLMTPVSPNWDVRGEYTYSVYGTVSQVGTPKVDEFSLGFMYRFEG